MVFGVCFGNCLFVVNWSRNRLDYRNFTLVGKRQLPKLVTQKHTSKIASITKSLPHVTNYYHSVQRSLLFQCISRHTSSIIFRSLNTPSMNLYFTFDVIKITCCWTYNVGNRWISQFSSSRQFWIFRRNECFGWRLDLCANFSWYYRRQKFG